MSFTLLRVQRVWHLRHTVDGKRVQRSTGETDRARAEAIAERAVRHAKLWARDSREIPTLRELVAQWIVIHEASASRAHIKVVETLGRLHLHGLGDILIDELTTDRVELARVRHLEAHAPISANSWLKVIRLLCNWAVRRGVMPAVPFRVRALKVQKRPRATLPVSLASAWIEAIDIREGRRDGVRTAVRLMLGLGLRESETLSARWEWLDVERKVYTPGSTKGREAVSLPVPEWLFSYLMERRQTAGLMLAKTNGKPYAPGFTRAAMLQANEVVGAPHLTAHRLRGTFATLLSRSGVPVQDIQLVLRHKNLLTTAAYLETDLTTVSTGQQVMAEQIGFGLPLQQRGAPVANSVPQTQQ